MIINSKDNKKVKQWMKYHHKKYRDKDNKFLVEGEHLVEEAIAAKALDVLIVREGTINHFDVPQVYYVSNEIINDLSLMTSKNDYIGVCNKIVKNIDDQSKRLIILDNVQDPGNVGTIIRTAYSFGYDGVILGSDCCDIYNEKVISATQGALFNMATYRCDLVKEIVNLKLKGYYIYGTDLQESTFLADLKSAQPTKLAIVVGNEGQGVKKDILALTNQNIKIEMKNFESLNVAVAASICMYTLK